VIAASAVVAAPAEVVFELLADLEGHWRLAGPWVHVLTADGDGGVVEVRGPLGLPRRRVRTRVADAVPHERVEGVAAAGRTRGRVRWTLEPAGAGCTEVRLEAVVERAAPLDRLLLAAGGARWLRRRFRSTLRRLAVEATKPSPKSFAAR
jgi:carbon monoxide dehydrogenase subunit G